MTTQNKDYLPGFTFKLQVPKSAGKILPQYTAKCVIVTHNTEKIEVFFTVGDWLAESFTIPTPYHKRTIMNSIYLCVREITLKLREEFLCTL